MDCSFWLSPGVQVLIVIGGVIVLSALTMAGFVLIMSKTD